MKKETKKETKIKSLRSYHGIIAALSLITLLFIVFTNDWSDWISCLPIVAAICLDGKFEKNDELAKQNISKANVVTMWALIAALLLLYMDGRFNNIPADYYLITISGAITLRSVLFLIFDNIPQSVR